MNKVFTSAFLLGLLALQTAYAGNPAPPVLEPAVVVENTSSSTGALIPIFLIVAIVGAALLGGGAAGSDARLKTDITRIGTAGNGLPLYQYRYRGLPMVYEGVMAQDVLAHTPEAVIPLPFGFMAVNYDKLGLEMRRVH